MYLYVHIAGCVRSSVVYLSVLPMNPLISLSPSMAWAMGVDEVGFTKRSPSQNALVKKRIRNYFLQFSCSWTWFTKKTHLLASKPDCMILYLLGKHPY